MSPHHHFASAIAFLLLLVPTSAADDKKPGQAPPPPPARVALTLEGHEAEVYCVKYSPDGNRIATASFDKTVKLWEAGSGKLLLTFAGHQGKVLTLAFSPDGRALLTGSEDKTLKLWDVPGEGAVSLAGHAAPVEALAMSPDSTWLATASTDGTVRVWNPAAAREVLKLEGSGGPTRSVAFSPDGKRLLSGGDDKTVRVWDVSSVTSPPPVAGPSGGVPVLGQGATWRYHKGTSEPPSAWKDPDFDASTWASGASGFGYSPDEDELATVATKLDDMMNNYLSIYIRATFKVENPGAVERLSLRVLIDDGMVAYLNGMEVGRDNIKGTPPPFNAATTTSHEALEFEIDLTPMIGKLVAGENVLAIQGHNQKLDSSDFVLTPALTALFKMPEKKEADRTRLDLAKLEGFQGPIRAVAWSPDGTLVAGAGDAPLIRVWKLADGSAVDLDQGAPVRGLAFLDGGQLAAAGDGGAIKVWSLAEGKVVRSLEGHEGAVLCLAARRDGSQLLSGGADRTVRLWDAAASKELKRLTGHEGPVASVAFAPDARTVISGGADAMLRVWNVETGMETRAFAQKGGVRAAAGGPNERYYAAAEGNEVSEWRVSSAEAVRTIAGHGDSVHAVAFSPDGARLASSSRDKTVRLWNRADGKELLAINAHESSIYAMGFNHDGSLLASAGFDRAVKLWNTADGSLTKTLDGHGEGVFCLRFSTDGQFVYSGSSDRTIRKWNVSEGKESAAFTGHESWVSNIAILPGEKRMVSMDYGGTLITWSLEDGKLLSRHKLPPPQTVVYDFALAPDGKRLATANLNKQAYVIDLEVP